MRKTRDNILYSLIFLNLGILLLMLSWYKAGNGRIEGFELEVFDFFNNWPILLGNIFAIVTWLGTLFFTALVAGVLLLKHQKILAFKVFFASSVAWLVASFIKNLSIRERPFEIISGVNVIGNKDMLMGFPSAHAALITGLTYILARHLKGIYRWIFIAVAISVAISRLVIGMHAPLDVIGGIGIGLIVGPVVDLLISLAAKKRLV